MWREHLKINELKRLHPLAIYLLLNHLRRADHQLKALTAHALDQHRQMQQTTPEDLHSIGI